MLAGVSVQAQRKSAQVRLTPPTFQPQQVVIQDDGGRGYLVFDPASGAYKSTLCEFGFVFSGTGQVKVDGCTVNFSDIQTGHRIFATVNMCDHQAKCAFEVFEEPTLRFDIEPIFETLVDTNTLNSTTECGGAISPK
jgi:hypothetical protein